MNMKRLRVSPKTATNGNGNKPRALTKSEERLRKADREFGRIWLSLAMHVVAPAHGESLPVVGITSPIGREGKTTHCLSLASALANEADSKVVIVECDLSQPSLAAKLGLEARPGLAELVEGSTDIEHILKVSRDIYRDSRYYFDPNFERERVVEFYTSWAQKAVLGTFDDYAYILADEDREWLGRCRSSSAARC